MAATPSIMPSSNADVKDVGAVLHLLPDYGYGFFVFAFLHQLDKAG